MNIKKKAMKEKIEKTRQELIRLANKKPLKNKKILKKSVELDILLNKYRQL